MAIKLILTDVNGTAMAHGRHAWPSEAVLGAAGRLKAAGVALALSTGLPGPEVADLAQALGVSGACVVNGGTEIYDMASGEVLRRVVMSTEQIAGLREAVSGLDLATVVDGEPGDGEAAERRLENLDEAAVVRFIGLSSERSEEVLTRLGGTGLAVAVVEGRRAGYSHIQVSDEAGSKGKATEALLKIYGVRCEEAVAVGDSGSDIAMFLAVGTAVAMGNGSDDVRGYADIVAPTVSEDGLAWVFDQVIEHGGLR